MYSVYHSSSHRVSTLEMHTNNKIPIFFGCLQDVDPKPVGLSIAEE